MKCDEIRNMLTAYVDQELAISEFDTVDAHCAGCAHCQEYLGQLTQLHLNVKRHAHYHSAPAALNTRIRALIAPPPSTLKSARAYPWRNWVNWGGALVGVIAFMLGIAVALSRPSDEARIADEAVSAHLRAAMAGHMIDVASSDRHTVKPWFSGKLDFSPPVRDFSAQGFPLVGGRLDYLDHQLAAALVYRYGAHQISVFIVPETKPLTRSATSIRGYQVVHQQVAAMDFWLVSDAEPAVITKLSQLLVGQ